MAKLIAIVTLLSLNCLIDFAEGFSCLKSNPVKDFQQEKVSGTWYAFARYVSEFDVGYRCLKCNFMTDVPNAIHLNADGIRSSDNVPIHYNVILEYVDNPTVANFVSHVKEVDSGFRFNETLEAIDYDTYQIYYGCSEKKQIDYCWILTKEPVISDELYQTILSVMNRLGIDPEYLHKIDQTNCTN